MPSEEERYGMRGPGRSLAEDPDAVRVMQSMRDKLAAVKARIRAAGVEPEDESPGDRGTHAPASPLAVSVDRLVRQRDGLASLCGEILATLTSPANAEQVKCLGPAFAGIVGHWRREFEKHSGAV